MVIMALYLRAYNLADKYSKRTINGKLTVI